MEILLSTDIAYHYGLFLIQQVSAQLLFFFSQQSIEIKKTASDSKGGHTKPR